MADKRTIKIEIGTEVDTKGIEKLRGALEDLKKATPIAESELRKVRNEVLEFSRQGGTSANSLKALETALTKLQGEAEIGSATWKLLGKDIAGVRQQVGELTGTIRTAAQAQEQLNRALNAGVSNTFGKLADQTANLKRELRDLNFRSEEYLRTLTRVRELETVGSFNQGRLNTIAANQAFMGATLSRGYGATENLPNLPDTLAGDAQRVSELNERIRNLDRGSELYLKTVKELATAQAQAARSQRELNTAMAESPVGIAQARLDAQRQVTATVLQENAVYAQNRAIRGSIRRNRERVAREQERQRRAAAEAFPATVILALPAAGGSSFQGAIDSRGFGGGARGVGQAQDYQRRVEPLIASYERLNATQQRRDAKLGAIGEYFASGDIATRRNDGFGDRPQVQVGAGGAMIAPPYRSGNYSGIGDAGLGQFGPESPDDFRRRVEPRVQAMEAAQEAINQVTRDAGRREVEVYAATERFKQERIDAIAANSLRQEKQRFDREIADFDRRLEGRVSRRADRNRRLREAGQTATAVGVAGYFGGPEAVAGAAAGAIFGPGGAQIGTTAGLAVGGIRAQVGRFSDQAAQLNKLQQSLRSIAGSESEYTRAIGAINTANRELNIPLLEGTRAMTQLTAAVKGAGGTVADAELAYNGITSAIKATGGSSADADGAIRALVQTFSKGKVSAEEIRQQLAERLPGAVTLFAQATGRTGAELDKAFEKGEVGLNDLMKFLATLNTRYSETARRIAASNDEAGLRLQLRWEQTTLAIGKAFQPLGAEIQNSFTKILTESEGSIRQWAQTTADGLKGIGKQLNEVVYLTGQFKKLLDSLPREVRVLLKLDRVGDLPVFDLLDGGAANDYKNAFSSKRYIKGLGGDSQSIDVFKKQLGVVKNNVARFQREGSSQLLEEQVRQVALEKQIAKLSDKKKEELKGSGNFKAPTPQATKDAEADKQRRLAEQLAAEQQRLRETAAQQEIRLADEVYRHQIELDDQRYERRRRRLEDQARAEIALLSPNRRDIASLAFAIQQGSSEDAAQRRQLEQAVQQAQRQVANAQRMAAVTAVGGATGGVIARTGSTGVSTGAHLDARWADGRPISAADVDRYLRVNGRAPSSFGVTSGYGPRRAPAPGASSFHRGVDFATPAGSGISVANGAKLLRDLGFTGAGGYAVEIDTPQGRMRLLHLQGGSATRTPTGVAAQQRRNVVDNADVLSANQGLASAQANLAAFDADQAGGAQARTNRLIAEYTQQTRDSTQALLENNQQLRDRTRYTLEGYRPEDIEFLVQKNAAERKYNETISQAKSELDAQRLSVDAYNKLIADQTDAHLRNADALRQQADAQREARLAAESGFDIRAGARQYVESIGTMRDASANLTQTGIRGIEEALTSLVTTGTANYQAFAVSILQDTARMIIQQMLLKTIMQAIGFIGGGGSSIVKGIDVPVAQMPAGMGFAKGGLFTEQGVQLFAKGGVVAKPTFFRYANGGSFANGVMGEAGPEAILPLKRGSDGKLGVSTGGGGSPVAVTVNVDASGTKAQGSSDQGQQLGRAVAAAVQAELVKQKRPGGLLAS